MNLNNKNIFETALKILSLRDHFKAELVKKLVSKGFDDKEIEETVERLKELKYINDDNAFYQIVNEYKRKRKGTQYIAAKLYEKTGNRFETEKIREFYSLAEETENAKKIMKSIKSSEVLVLKKKLFTRGFSFESIKEALNGWDNS